MKKVILLTVVLLSTMIVAPSQAQNSCNNFHKRKCFGSEDPAMRYNNQSKSGLFVLGHTSDLVFVAHAGQDYRVSLCQDKKVEEPIKFKVLDGRSKEVLFDNEQMDFDVPAEDGAEGDETEGSLPDYFEFSCDVTKKIIIRITAPGPPPAEGEKRGKREEPDPEDLFCVGVLLEYMPTPKLGF